jgi:hypothetical protein
VVCDAQEKQAIASLSAQARRSNWHESILVAPVEASLIRIEQAIEAAFEYPIKPTVLLALRLEQICAK